MRKARAYMANPFCCFAAGRPSENKHSCKPVAHPRKFTICCCFIKTNFCTCEKNLSSNRSVSSTHPTFAQKYGSSRRPLRRNWRKALLVRKADAEKLFRVGVIKQLNFMKKKIITSFIAGACCFIQAQATQVISLSTGVNNSTGALIPVNTNDDTWLVELPGSSVFNPVKCATTHSSWADDPAVRWISPNVDSYGNPNLGMLGNFTYKTTFVTAGCTMTGATLTLNKYGADNTLTNISVNGHNHALNASFGTLSTLISFNITSELVAGTNTITVTVYNEKQTFTGLLIDGDIKVNYLPDPNLTPAISGSSSFCYNDFITFTGSTTGSSAATSYKWTFFESNSSGTAILGGYTVSSPEYNGAPGNYTVPATPGCGKYYTIMLSVYNVCGGPVNAYKTIYISCYPVADAGPDQTICSGDCATIGGSSTAGHGTTYSWITNVGHSSVIIGSTETLSVCPRTTQTYTLSVTNGSGCTTMDVVTVNVQTNDPSFSISNNTSNASYYTVTATPNVLSPPSGTGYAWFLEDLDSSGNDIFKIDNPSVWQTFPSTPSNVFKGFVGSTSYPAPPATVTSLPSSPAAGQFLYYHTYRVTRATWTAVCPWAQFSQTLTVVKSLTNGQPEIVVTEDENAPDMSGYLNTATGISPVAADNAVNPVAIYPNPGTGVFTVTVGKGQSSEGVLEVYDVLGNKVQSVMLHANTSDYKLDLSGYSKGIYMLNMISGDQRYSEKIILE